MYEKRFKRPLDIVLSLLGLVFLSPILLIIALLVRFKLGSPVLYKQKRPGLNERIFKMYKFRSMTNETDEKGKLLPDTVRLTPFGQKLRATSLDELPSLFNILKGDMSTVGPRPLLVEYLPLYNQEQRKRHRTRPGLTGYAQVNGRNLVDWEEKFEYDLFYINNITFWNDLKILIKTIKTVIGKEGIVTQETKDYVMIPFTGTEKESEVDHSI